MATTFLQDGDVLTHTAGATISSGDVVELSDVVGVALNDAASGAEVECKITGVFTLAKVSGTAFVQGDALNWDASAGNFTKSATAATGDITGGAIAAATAASGATSAAVRLCPGSGTGS